MNAIVFHKGKTSKDHRSGAKQRNTDNKQLRADWNNDTTLKRSQANFPFRSCNGKRNRSVITGKTGKQIRLNWTIHNSMR